ncbi:hypothetical protein FISHEDRAFT_52488 [Fistulina hepatica ATCC 64428]|nr:hypothetical protein FISHEDRAFT_52488 [Fistulina hepatica ATCC 64428]
MYVLSVLSPIQDIITGLRIGLWPTLKDLWRSPLLILRPRAVSHIYMAHVWRLFGQGIDANCENVKQPLIYPNASGTVLDLGAGYGHTVRYFDRARVQRYVALEPNLLMHSEIRAAGEAAGYRESDGTLVILPYGAQDITNILNALGSTEPCIDTIISVLTLCTVPNPAPTIAALVRHILKPGGKFLFYEHVLGSRADVAWWQRLWTPIWSVFFDGCRMDRPSHEFVARATMEGDYGDDTAEPAVPGSAWQDGRMWRTPGEPEDHMFPHRTGCFVKKNA